MSSGVDHVVTSGTFSLDGGTWDVDNNVWIVGDEQRGASSSTPRTTPDEIAAAVGGRRVVAVVCTHAHDDHVNQAPALADRFAAPILLQPGRGALWDMTYPDRKPDGDCPTATCSPPAGSSCARCTTPGALPRLDVPLRPELGTVFTGDTLFQGGPGATGPVVLVVRHDHRLDPLDRCSRCPATPRSAPGHGDSTTIGAEAPHLEEWIANGELAHGLAQDRAQLRRLPCGAGRRGRPRGACR